jgi:putative lipoic acid-binding regulatory protein
MHEQRRRGFPGPRPGTPPEDTLFEFPVDFPVKIMGQASDEFRSLALGIVTRHFGELTADRIEERPSSNGKYLSITCTVFAAARPSSTLSTGS